MSLTTCIFLLHFFILSLSMPECRDTAYGRSCSLPLQPTRTLATRDVILVGTANALHSFDMLLSYKSSADLTLQGGPTSACEPYHECLNYVKVITQVPLSSPLHAGEVFVCGTNYRQPKCYFFNPINLTVMSPLSGNSSVDAGYCPFQPYKTVVSIFASNGNFFSGTTFSEFTSQGSIGMARNALRGDRMFVTTSNLLQTWINNGDPSFVAVYEMNGYVYFFLTELAKETTNTQLYSRVIRICANDTTVDTYSFRTFQKARIVCTNAPDQSSLAYSYDELKATALSNGILYGAFSSAANGPKGAAICKFSFDGTQAGSITAAFGAGKYLTLSGTNWQEQTESPFSCPGTSRTMDQIGNNILLKDPIQSVGSTPLLQLLGASFTAIAADTFSSFGRTYEVLFYALDGGGIEQLIIVNGSTYRSPLTAAVGNRYVTRELTIVRSGNNTRQLYATTTSSIDAYFLGNCSLYVDCLTCLTSMDPYCAWNMSAGRCVSKLDLKSSDHLVEGYAINRTTMFDICGQKDNATAASSNTSSTTTEPTFHCEGLPPAVGVNQQSRSSVPGGAAAGAAIGGFCVGIPVGVVLCAVALIVKRMVFTNNNNSDCAGTDVCKTGGISETVLKTVETLDNAFPNGGTPVGISKNSSSTAESTCKHSNTNRSCNGAIISANGGGHTHPAHNPPIHKGYQGEHQSGSQESGDDDVIVESGVVSGSHTSSNNKLRTESTRWLTTRGSNESSEADSPPV